MSTKALVTLGMVIGSLVGGYAPTILGAGLLSFWSIIGSMLGGLLGIWVGYRLGNF